MWRCPCCRHADRDDDERSERLIDPSLFSLNDDAVARVSSEALCAPNAGGLSVRVFEMDGSAHSVCVHPTCTLLALKCTLLTRMDAGNDMASLHGVDIFVAGSEAPLEDAEQVNSFSEGVDDLRGELQLFMTRREPSDRILQRVFELTSGRSWRVNRGWTEAALVPGGSSAPARDLNQWHGVTAASGRVTKLKLKGNSLQGGVPNALGELCYLEILDLFNNTLSGPVPHSLGRLLRLKKLMLATNRLCGALPACLSGLQALVTLNVKSNQ